MQNQVGHEHPSTTSIYTCVSSDFRTRTLRTALDATVHAALTTPSTTSIPTSTSTSTSRTAAGSPG